MESANKVGDLSAYRRLGLAHHLRNTRMSTAGDYHEPIPSLHYQSLLDYGTNRASRVDAGDDLKCIGDLYQPGLIAHLLLEEPQESGRRVHRGLDTRVQQCLQAADMIVVLMREDDSLDGLGIYT